MSHGFSGEDHNVEFKPIVNTNALTAIELVALNQKLLSRRLLFTKLRRCQFLRLRLACLATLLRCCFGILSLISDSLSGVKSCCLQFEHLVTVM